MTEQDRLPPGFIEELQEIVRVYRESKARRLVEEELTTATFSPAVPSA